MTSTDELWLPLVDEPIGSIVDQIVADDPELAALVSRPRRLLAFKTFAYIRVGIALGELLVEHDVPPYDGTDTWVELLLREPAHREEIVRAVKAVADEIAADPQLRGRGAARARRGRPGALPRVRAEAARLV